MNFLAHFHLADISDSSITGNLLGDFVKGQELGHYPEHIQQGIRLHRAVDLYTDRHPEVRAALPLISADRRRFAGIIVDMAFDHFLARHWLNYHSEPLSVFTEKVYAELSREQHFMPNKAQKTVFYMQRHDWLRSYTELRNIAQALDGIAARLSRKTTLYGSGVEVEENYAKLEKHFIDFYPQLLSYVKDGFSSDISEIK